MLPSSGMLSRSISSISGGSLFFAQVKKDALFKLSSNLFEIFCLTRDKVRDKIRKLSF
jgi:hypothetical protein